MAAIGGGWDDFPEPEEMPEGFEFEMKMRRVRPSDRGRIIRFNEAGLLQLADIRWGLIPRHWTGTIKDWVNPVDGSSGKRKSIPFTNARSETVSTTSAFGKSYADRRCLVPAAGYIEYTGETYPKTRHRFTVGNQPMFMMAGLWDASNPADGPLESFTILTTDPGPDAARYHNRQPVILRPDQYAGWLNPANDMAPAFKGGSPEGLLQVKEAPLKKAA